MSPCHFFPIPITRIELPNDLSLMAFCDQTVPLVHYRLLTSPASIQHSSCVSSESTALQIQSSVVSATGLTGSIEPDMSLTSPSFYGKFLSRNAVSFFREFGKQLQFWCESPVSAVIKPNSYRSSSSSSVPSLSLLSHLLQSVFPGHSVAEHKSDGCALDGNPSEAVRIQAAQGIPHPFNQWLFLYGDLKTKTLEAIGRVISNWRPQSGFFTESAPLRHRNELLPIRRLAHFSRLSGAKLEILWGLHFRTLREQDYLVLKLAASVLEAEFRFDSRLAGQAASVKTKIISLGNRTGILIIHAELSRSRKSGAARDILRRISGFFDQEIERDRFLNLKRRLIFEYYLITDNKMAFLRNLADLTAGGFKVEYILELFASGLKSIRPSHLRRLLESGVERESPFLWLR